MLPREEVGRRGLDGNFATSAQFFCKSKTALQKSLLKKKSERDNTILKKEELMLLDLG